MLCTDVNGVYTGNPSDPGSELLPTYSPEVRRADLTARGPSTRAVLSRYRWLVSS